MAVAFSYILLDLDIVGCSLWTWTLQTRIQHPEVDGLWRDIQAPKINDWKKIGWLGVISSLPYTGYKS